MINLSRDGVAGCDLLLRLEGVSLRAPPAMVPLSLERGGEWRFDRISSAEVAPHQVVLRDVHGQHTRIRRLLLPAGLERALHVGQFATRQLGLPTIATPFLRSHTPGPPRQRPASVIVWTEPAVRSRLALWWACASFPAASIWVVPIPQSGLEPEEGAHTRTVGELMEAAPGVRRLTSHQVARLASNWSAWRRGDGSLRRVAMSGWPEAAQWLGHVPQWIWNLFPVLADGLLQLSPYDQHVLRGLGSSWSSTMAALRRMLDGPADRLVQAWGDLTFHNRLHAWSRWKGGRYVEQRPSQSHQSFSALEYRLTREGQRLLVALPSLDVAPAFVFGAFRYYARGSWVMTARGPRRAPASCFSS